MVIYKIRVGDDTGEWTVSRRFRNFETLHRALRYTLLLVSTAADSKGFHLQFYEAQPNVRQFSHAALKELSIASTPPNLRALLRTVLCRDLPSYHLRLPAKRIFSQQQSVEFVEERRQQLNGFLQSLLAIPPVASRPSHAAELPCMTACSFHSLSSMRVCVIGGDCLVLFQQ